MKRRICCGAFFLLWSVAAMIASGCGDSTPTRFIGGGGSTSPATIKAVPKDQKPG
ncbi:MAG: hypothetical protein U0798_09585 [Gemmataceae bacterium]